MQIAIVLIYAFLVWVPPYEFNDPAGPVNFVPIVTTVLLFLMVVVGNDFIYVRIWWPFRLHKKTSMVSPRIQSSYCLSKY